MLAQLPKPAIIAHRGASAHAPENTLAAFSLAIEQRADMLEFDVKLTLDKQVVVIHDQTVDRTTKGHGRVNQLSLAEMKELDAGSYFDVAYRGERIPTLEETLEIIDKRKPVNIELTNYASPNDDLPERVCNIVKSMGYEAHTLFSSFNPAALRKAKKLLPEVPAGFLALAGWRGWLPRSIFAPWITPHNALHPDFQDVTAGLVERVHRQGRQIFTYTVNNQEVMAHLFALGVDGIFTDDPVLARTIRDKRQLVR